jgi:hypothetical protein
MKATNTTRKEKRKEHRLSGVKNYANMDLKTMKEEGQRERKIRTACKGEGEIKERKGKVRKAN